ncbi:MAG: ATP-binding protein [Pyrinomonadaceae bacterium]
MFNSIRIKLTLWYLGVLAVIIVAFAVTTYFLIERSLDRTTDKNLSEMAQTVEDELLQEEKDLAEEIRQMGKATDDDGRAGEDADEREEEPEKLPTIEEAIREEITDLKFKGYRFTVFDRTGTEVVSTVGDEGLRKELRNLSPEAGLSDVASGDETFRVNQKRLRLDGKDFRLLVAYSLGEQTAFINFLKKIFYWVVPGALLLAGVGGYVLARQSLAPVAAMRRRAERIGSSNLNERLPVGNETDELGRLASVFNALLARLENSFRQQQRFMADASHELRTPLTIIRTESEVALSREKRSTDEYRESLAIIGDESRRLTRIVEDLFLLARADREQFEPQFRQLRLDDVLAEAVHSIRALAEKRNVRIDVSDLPEMPLRADEALLHRLFLNLFDNAIKYNREGGAVSIEVSRTAEKYLVSVSDTGVGIRPEDQMRIFDRFYRADEARSRDDEHISGGAGLGLSIAAWIAEVHGGSLVLERSDPEGSVFRVELAV